MAGGCGFHTHTADCLVHVPLTVSELSVVAAASASPHSSSRIVQKLKWRRQEPAPAADVLRSAGKKALDGGIAGALAMVLQMFARIFAVPIMRLAYGERQLPRHALRRVPVRPCLAACALGALRLRYSLAIFIVALGSRPTSASPRTIRGRGSREAEGRLPLLKYSRAYVAISSVRMPGRLTSSPPRQAVNK